MKRFAKGFVVETKENVITGAVASTGSLDRDNEVIDPMGWQLDNFKKAPRLLWSHNARELPIGKVNKIFLDEKGNLRFDAEFASKENDFAAKVEKLMKNGFLNTFSVGFIPHEFDGSIIKKAELLEISVVNIPANPEARLSHEYKSFEENLEKLEIKEIDKNVLELMEIIKQAKTKIQTLILSKEKFKTLDAAKKWVTDHDFHVSKVDETDESWRFRQFEPTECQDESFRTIKIDDGVTAVICRPKEGKNCDIITFNESEKLSLVNLIKTLNETSVALTEKLKKVSAGNIEKKVGPRGAEQLDKNKTLKALRLIDRSVEIAIKQIKNG